MKKMKKISAVLLSSIMVMGFASTVSAATLTVDLKSYDTTTETPTLGNIIIPETENDTIYELIYNNVQDGTTIKNVVSNSTPSSILDANGNTTSASLRFVWNDDYDQYLSGITINGNSTYFEDGYYTSLTYDSNNPTIITGGTYVGHSWMWSPGTIASVDNITYPDTTLAEETVPSDGRTITLLYENMSFTWSSDDSEGDNNE